jgi:hypothetical protein
VTIKASVVLSGFKLDILPKQEVRRVIRGVGTKLATRIRQRLRASGKFKATGQLIKSIKFRMNRTEPRGTISPAGIRETSDGHKHRKPMSNFAVAAFQSAAHGLNLEATPEDEQRVTDQIERELEKLIGK